MITFPLSLSPYVLLVLPINILDSLLACSNNAEYKESESVKMSSVIELLLKKREEIKSELEKVTASLRAELIQAESALIVLGHKFDNPFIGTSNTIGVPNIKNPTIKQRVTQALTERYPEGAHYSAILDYINQTWPHLPVKRTSLSPQLTRLRNKVIELDEDKGIWHLIKQEAENSSTSTREVESDVQESLV